MSEVKKVTVSLDGVVIGTRRNTRAYTHAIVDSEKKEVVSYHLTPAADGCAVNPTSSCCRPKSSATDTHIPAAGNRARIHRRHQ